MKRRNSNDDCSHTATKAAKLSSQGSNNEKDNNNEGPVLSPEEEFKQLVELCTGEELSLDALKEKVAACSSEAVRSHGTGETLLHHVCANKKVSLEMVYYLLSLYPEAIKHAKAGCPNWDDKDVLPLHRACANQYCPNSVVEYLVSIYPQALSVSYSNGGLPLHCLLWRTHHHPLDVGLVRMIVSKYPEALTNKENEYGHTPLVRACYGEHVSLELVRALVDEDCEAISLATPDGDFPLHAIVSREDGPVTPLEIVQYLLEKAPGVIRRRNSSRRTPLHVACAEGNVSFKAMRLLVESGDRNLLNQPPFPLHLLTSNDCMDDQQELMDIIQYFVQQSPNSLTVPDDQGCLPLHYSCRGWPAKFNEVVKFLVRQYPQAVAILNHRNELPIHYASLNGNVGLVRLLYDIDSNSVSVRTVLGDLPLHLACLSGNGAATVRFFMEKHAHGEKIPGCNGNLPLHLVSLCMNDDDLSLVRDLFNAYPKAIHVENNDGSLPLHLAFDSWKPRNENLIQFLMEQLPYGIRAQDIQARLPFHFACRNRTVSLDLLRKATEAFPDALRVNSPMHGLPIHTACKADLGLDIIKYLESMYPESLNVCNESLGLPLECAESQELLMYFLHKRYNQGPDQPQALLVIFHSILNDDAIKNKTTVASRLVGFVPSLASDVDHSDGSLPLHQAVASNVELSFIKKLIELNPSAVETTDSTGRLPVHYSLQRHDSRVDTLSLLLEKFPQGASATDHGNHTPLHVACRYGASLQVVLALTEAFPDGVLAQDHHGCVPLHIASRYGSSLEVVKHLIECDETTLHMLDESDDTHLHQACRGGHCNLVQYLVDRAPPLASKLNQSGQFPVLLLSQFDGNDPNIQDTPEYVETIWKLLLAHPECVMNALP